MQTVKFIPESPAEKQFAVALRKNVNDYFKQRKISAKGNSTMYLKAFVLLTLYILPFILILSMSLSPTTAILLFVVMGIGEAGVGMCVMHDAAHGAFSEKQWVNKLFARTMYLLGSNTLNWKIQHNYLHHNYTNVYGYDQDIETKAVIRLCKHAPLKKFHRMQHIYAYFLYGLMTFAKLFTDLPQLLSYHKRGLVQDPNYNASLEIIKLILTKLVYFFILIGLPLMLTELLFWHIILGFSLLHITAGMIMSTVFQMAHVIEGAEQPILSADGVINHDWTVHQLMTTSDFARNNILVNWYCGGLNFQIEHHLFRNICHVHYKEIAVIVQKTAEEYGLHYNLKPSLAAAFMSHARQLKKLGTPVSD